jgi:Abortive infection C-terminus
MEISPKTSEFFRGLVTGDAKLTSYRSGPDLVDLFRRYGSKDSYGSGFPSRWRYAHEKIVAMNGTPAMDRLITDVLNPVNFIGQEQQLQDILQQFNRFLDYDGYRVEIRNKRCVIVKLNAGEVECEVPAQVDDEFVQDQIRKATDKLATDDFDGAITNARSLVEAVLGYVYKQVKQEDLPKSGDLKKDYKNVRDHLKLSPDAHTDETIRQVLNGLTSVIDGIETLSNQMGDRHRRKLKPTKRHAKLVVNAAKTVADFILDTFQSISKPAG